jgi:hypothetical protein
MKDEIIVEKRMNTRKIKIFSIIMLFIMAISNLCQLYSVDYPADTPEEATVDNRIGISLSSPSTTSIVVKITDNWTNNQYSSKGIDAQFTLNYKEANQNTVSKSISTGSQTITLNGLKENTSYSVWITYSYLPGGRTRMYLKTSPYAITTQKESTAPSGDNTSTCSGDFWACAGSWFSDAGGIPALPSEAQGIIDKLLSYVNLVGTAAFIIVTAYLGIKYMYGSIESRASIKESMVTLLVAALFFFGWNSIWNIVYQKNNAFVLTQGTTDFGSIVNKIYTVFIYAGNFFAIGAIIYIGVRYLISGASGKADLKAKSTQFLLGIVMAFATINFLTYISNAINAVIK